jgi:Uri superfamily endonuclease
MMKGIYCLLINVKKDIKLKVGALGITPFKKGKYVYVGSAQNNLGKRVARHFRKKGKKLKWHIDYLLNSRNAKITNVEKIEAQKSAECLTALKYAKSGIPINGFGCSDCKCKSHLFRIR